MCRDTVRHCEYCGKPLSADAAPRKRFCSAECERRSYYEGRRDKDHAREEAEEGIPLREFQCEQCGHWVRVMSKSDKRFRFCSAKCEKAFWKRNEPRAARRTAAPAGKGFGGGYFERCCKWCGKAFGTQSATAMYCCAEHKRMARIYKKQNAEQEKKATGRKYRPFVDKRKDGAI